MHDWFKSDVHVEGGSANEWICLVVELPWDGLLSMGLLHLFFIAKYSLETWPAQLLDDIPL